MADSKTLYRGKWWVPGDEENPQFGTVAIDSDGSAQLDLVGSFVVMKEVPAPGSPGVATLRNVSAYPVILGVAGSRDFTLLNCRTLSAPNSFRGRPDAHVISAQRALRGEVLVDDPDAAIFTGMKISLDYLLMFSARSSLSHTHEFTGDPPQLTDTGVSAPVEPIVARWQDFTFTLSIFHGEFFFEHRDPGSRTLSSTEYAWLEVVPDEPVPLSRLDAISSQLRDLLTLAFDHPCSVRATLYRIPLPEPRNEFEAQQREYMSDYHTTEYKDQVYKPDAGAYEDRLRATYLFALHCMDFGQLIPAWFDLYSQIETAAQLLFGLKYLERGYVPNKLMTTCAALEALHSSLYDHEQLSPGDFKRLRAQAKANVDADLRPRLAELLHNRLDYDKRALELSRQVSPSAVEALVGDAMLWAELVKNARNTLAHATTKKPVSDSVRYYLTLVTRPMLSLVIAAKLGLDEEEQLRFANVYWSASSAFKRLTGQLED